MKGIAVNMKVYDYAFFLMHVFQIFFFNIAV